MTTPVVYRRGATEIEINATLGRSRFESVDESDMVVDLEMQDFIVRTEDMVMAGNPIVPMNGDEIDHEGGNGVVQTFQVLAPPGEPLFKYEGEARLSMRIHTKQVSE